MSKWDEYITKTSDREPNSLLQRALLLVVNKERALDLGAGALNDAKFLKEFFKEVDVVDQNPKILEIKRDLNVNRHVSTFENFLFAKKYDLITAQWSLPFNAPQTFVRVVERIKGALNRHGVFVAQFFGPEDEWSLNKSMTF